jgi:hypothetical protein
MNKGTAIDVYMDGYWWWYRAMSGPDKAGFVHLTYDVGLGIQDVVRSAKGP